MPPPHVGGCDDGEFTYDGHDGMVRDVRNYTFNHLSIPSLLTMPLGTRPWLISSNKFRDTIDRDLGLSPAGSFPPADGAPGPSGDAPGVDSPVSPGGVAVVLPRVVDLRGVVARHAVVVVRRVGVVLVVDEVMRRRVLLPDRLRSNRTPRP